MEVVCSLQLLFIFALHNCGRGEIGRHARLRIWCREVCRFESYRPHNNQRDLKIMCF